MMRLNLQLTMGTFSLSLFGLMGVAFGMNLMSSFEEVYKFGSLQVHVLKIATLTNLYNSKTIGIRCHILN